MKTILKNSILTFLIVANASIVLANECGWSTLTEGEQSQLLSGQKVMRVQHSSDGIRFQIDQWSFLNSPSVDEAAANYYTFRDVEVPGVVDATRLANVELKEGQVVSNNPVLYDVSPVPGNWLGHLYLNYTYEATIGRIPGGYHIQVDYLTSPVIVRYVFNDMCFTTVDGRVFFHLSSKAVGSSNPIIKAFLTHSRREQLWGSVFDRVVVRASQKATPEKMKDLETALTEPFVAKVPRIKN